MIEKNLIDKLTKIIEPIVLEKGYELYHLEFVLEDNENYLRIYIDNEPGINLDDCVKVSKAISLILDDYDPIKVSYCLEVSSPGINRTLFNEKHIQKYIGSNVNLELTAPFEGLISYVGKLSGFNSEYIKIDYQNKNLEIPRKLISVISLS